MIKKEIELKPNPEFRRNPYPGLYIAFEGNDGSGHTTQMDILSETFKEKGITFKITKEPNENYFLGDAIRFILKENIEIDPLGFQKMYLANRRNHEEKLVIPALKFGKALLSDRCFLSTIAYGSLAGKTDNLIKQNIDFISPDIIFLLDTPAEICIKRKGLEKKELFERVKILRRVGQTYCEMAKRYPSLIKRLPGEKKIEEISLLVFEHVSQNQKFINLLTSEIPISRDSI